MNFSFNFYNNLKNIFKVIMNLLVLCLTLIPVNTTVFLIGKKKLRYTTNHDESAWDATPMTLFNGKQGALAASVITSYLNGVPLIYGSQECWYCKHPFHSLRNNPSTGYLILIC